MARILTMQDAVHRTLGYIKGRRDGTITSLKTAFPKLNKATIDGFEWQSTITIAGRPSTGKSAYSDIIIDGCFDMNLDANRTPTFNVYDCNWELSSQVMLLRRLSARFKKSYKHIISADDNTITEEEFEELTRILTEEYGTLPWVFSEEPESVEAWGKSVEDHLKTAKTPTLVRVDHTLLCRQVASEASQVQMLLNLMMKANMLKKKYQAIFMFLTQINREFEDRQESGTDKAFPRQGDVYGGDAAAMFSETMIILNKPAKYGVTMYGKRTPGKEVVHENDLFAHVVKNRNSDADLILQYKENFKHMSLREH